MWSSAMDSLRFELGYHFRRPTFWLVALVFGVFGFADLVSNASRGNAFFFVNSPSQVFQTTVWYTLFSVLAATAFVAETFVRDARCGMESLVLATPVRKFDYLALRFAAAFVVTVLAFSCYVPGMLLGSLMPGLNPYAMGPTRLDAFAWSYISITLPNLLTVSVFAFVLSARFRSMVAAYVGAIVLVMLYIGMMLMVGVDQIDYDMLHWWSLFDPYGYFSLESATLTWTVHQHNTEMPNIGDVFLFNRLMWLGVAVMAWLLAYRAFDMRPATLRSTTSVRRARHTPSAKMPEENAPKAMRAAEAVGVATTVPPVTATIRALGWKQLPRLAAFEINLVLKSHAFQMLVFCGLASLLFAATGSKSFEHSNPSTDILIHTASLYFDYVLFAIIVFYAAELMWRDHDYGIQGVVDAAPLPTWLMVLSKLTTLFFVITLNLLLCMLVMALYQAGNGYFQFEFGLSALMLLLVHGPYFYFIAVLALFCQALTRHKYGGIMLVLLIALTPIPLDAFGLHHNLYRFGATNDLGYSPMNGYGGLLEGHWWFVAYWSAFCAVVVLLTTACWPRGSGGKRFALAHMTMPARAALGGSVVATGLVAAWILYNTTILNAWQPPGRDALAVQHEKSFKQYENLPMPVVTATRLKVDLFPQKRYFIAKGSYTLENHSGQPISEIHLSTFVNLHLVEATMPGARLREAHTEAGYYIYTLDTPMQPGAQATLEFVTRTAEPKGFRNESDADDVYMMAPNDILQNGTSLYSPFILPFIGYTKMVEHKEAWKRHKFGLPPLDERMRAHDDPAGLARASFASHLTWGTADIIASTSVDQAVVSNGDEVKRWSEQGRNYVRYRSDRSGQGRFTLYSARFETQRETTGDVELAAWYHPEHSANARPMLQQLKTIHSFYESILGPSPLKQLSMVEFAYYPGMVFWDNGTLGVPEALVWKSDLKGDGEDAMVGWLTYLLSHAWIEHELITADVAGALTVREAIAGYLGNLYRRSIYSPQRFDQVKQQQMRNYFRALGQADYAEPALDQVYHEVAPARFKGQMVMELIESQIGQPALLAGVRDFIARFRDQPAPYATIVDLQSSILQQSPPSLRNCIAELFSSVITYQYGVVDARYEQHGEDSYRVKLDVEARKLYTRNLGEQQASVLDWPLDVIVQNEAGDTIYSGKLKLNAIQQHFELALSERPFRVLLDPQRTLPAAVATREKRVRVVDA